MKLSPEEKELRRIYALLFLSVRTAKELSQEDFAEVLGW
jgi:hypothetical protein